MSDEWSRRLDVPNYALQDVLQPAFDEWEAVYEKKAREAGTLSSRAAAS